MSDLKHRWREYRWNLHKAIKRSTTRDGFSKAKCTYPTSFSDQNIIILDTCNDEFNTLYYSAGPSSKVDVDTLDVVGSNLQTNSGRWGDILMSGFRDDKIHRAIALLSENPRAFIESLTRQLSLIEVDGQYYQSGDAAHRMVVFKFHAALNNLSVEQRTLKAVSVHHYKRRDAYDQYKELTQLLTRNPHLTFNYLKPDDMGTRFMITNNNAPAKNNFLHFREQHIKSLVKSLKGCSLLNALDYLAADKLSIYQEPLA